MVAPRLRSRSYIKKKLTTPGGRKTVHYKKKATSYARCGSCDRLLLGVPRTKVSKLRKSQRVPNRPFGGNLCTLCTRSLIKKQARG